MPFEFLPGALQFRPAGPSHWPRPDFEKNFTKFQWGPLSDQSALLDWPRPRGKLMVDDRSPSAKALAVVSQITSISLSGALPLVIGYALDSWLNTRPVLLVVGGLFGAVTAVYLMIQLVRRLEADANSNKPSS